MVNLNIGVYADEPPSEPPGGDTEMTEDKGDNEDTEQTGEDTLPVRYSFIVHTEGKMRLNFKVLL